MKSRTFFSCFVSFLVCAFFKKYSEDAKKKGGDMMAFLSMSMYSEILQMDTGVNVLLPENRKGKMDEYHPDKRYPILYCLHGHGDDQSAWIRKSNIENIARNYEVIVVMPTVQRGWYSDGIYDYFSYICQELPIKMANFFPISDKREDTYIMGNSMGGYGALKAALTYPEKYAAAAALSPALPQTFYKYHNEFSRGIQIAVGDEERMERSKNDLLHLADLCTSDIRVFSFCGRQDWIAYEGFQLLDEHIKERCKELNYRSFESDGGHDWGFWNPAIQYCIESFGFKKIGDVMDG